MGASLQLPRLPRLPGDPAIAVAQKPAAGNRWLEQATGTIVWVESADQAASDQHGAYSGDEHRTPGPANPAESEVFDTFVLPPMFANAATGE